MSDLIKTDTVSVNDLYVINVFHCVKIYPSRIKYISENFLAIKIGDNFQEFFSKYDFGVLLKYDSSFTPSLDVMYVTNVIPLSRYYKEENSICKAKLFKFITDLNSFERVISLL